MKISAIVCTSNRPAGLARLLRALLEQERLADELIIVEDRGGPEPRDILDSFTDKGVRVSYLRRSTAGLTASRNLALKHARGDLLSFFDDDTTPAGDYFRVVEQVFAADSGGRLGGLAPVLDPWDHRPGLGDRLWQFLMHVGGLWSLPHRRRKRIFSRAICFRYGLRGVSFLPGVVTYRRAAIRGLGFDGELCGYGLGEDLEFSFSLHREWQLYRSSALNIRHHHDPLHRPNRLAMGKMLVRNLLYITCKHSGSGVGVLIVLLWQLMGLCFGHLLFSIVGHRAGHLAWLAGMIRGLPQAIRHLYRAGPYSPLAGSSGPEGIAKPARAKHILFVVNALELGGAEQLTATVMGGLDPRRFTASLLCLGDPGSLAVTLPGRVGLHHNFLAHKFDISVLWAMVRLISGGRVDLVISVDSGSRMFWSSLACLLTGRPLVIWCHSYPTRAEPTLEWHNRLLRTVAKSFVAVCSSQVQALVRVSQIPRSRIKIIENCLPGSAVPAERPSAEQLASFRQKLNLRGDAFLIVTVGNLRRVKGHEVLIDAGAEVLGQHDNVYFLLIGHGPEEESIGRHIRERDIDPGRILFLGERFDVPELLRYCDLFVSSSHKESFGLAVLEAMAASVAVIATETSGSRFLIEHNRTGLLVPRGRPDRLARAILALLGDPGRRDRLAEQARRFASQERFCASGMVRAFEELFELLT